MISRVSLIRKSSLRLYTSTRIIQDNNKKGIPKKTRLITSSAVLLTPEEAALLEDDHEIEEHNPWGTLLTPPSRALWRTTASYPHPNNVHPSKQHPNPTAKALLLTQFALMQECARTKRQLFRTHAKMLEKQKALVQFRESTRFLESNQSRRSEDSIQIKKDNLEASGTACHPLGYNPEQTVVALKYRLVQNFHVVDRVLREARSLLRYSPDNKLSVKKILDMGVGLGSSSVAAMEVFGEKNELGDGGVEWIHGVDVSKSMREVSDRVLTEVMKMKEKRVRFTTGESIIDGASADNIGGTFDLALCCYTAQELPHTASILSLAAIMWEKLNDNGLLVIVEPGTPDGFNTVRSIREMLLECCPVNSDREGQLGGEEAHVIAPCTHHYKCPMERHAPPTGNIDSGKKWIFDDDGDVVEFDEEDNEEDDENLWDFSSSEHDQDGHQNTLDMTQTKTHDPWTGEEEDHPYDQAFCSFVHALPKSTSTSSGKTHGRKGEKFSYLVVQKRMSGSLPETNASKNTQTHEEVGKTNNNLNPFSKIDLVQMLSKSLSTTDEETKETYFEEAKELETFFLNHSTDDGLGLDFISSQPNFESWGRLVRAPLKKKGHVIIDYCSAPRAKNDGKQKDKSNKIKGDHSSEYGEIVRSIVSKKNVANVHGLYYSGRKARWGGLWPDLRVNARILAGGKKKDQQNREDNAN